MVRVKQWDTVDPTGIDLINGGEGGAWGTRGMDSTCRGVSRLVVMTINEKGSG